MNKIIRKYLKNYILIVTLTLNCFNVTGQGFKEVASEIGIDHFCYDALVMGGGIASLDYDNDGDEDLYLVGGLSSDKLYRNNGNGFYEDVSDIAGLNFTNNFYTVGVVAGDFDNDGFRDLFVTTGRDTRNILLSNNSDGTFSDISEQAGILEISWSTSATIGDYNLDGLPDIYVGNYVEYDGLPFDAHLVAGLPNFLYENLGNNQFEEVAVSMQVEDNGAALAVAFSDVDDDGDVDIVIANDFGHIYEPNALYINEDGDFFSSVADQAGVNYEIHGMGIAIGDYDKDGDRDYYITDLGPNLLHNKQNNGMLYSEMSEVSNVEVSDMTSWGAAFFDYDNDSNLDLAVANGNVLGSRKEVTSLFKGDGLGNFSDVATSQNIVEDSKTKGLAVLDYDNDGDLDLIVTAVSDDEASMDKTLFYKNNNENTNNWLKVKLQGTYSNRDGIGSSVKVFVDNEVLIREIDGGSSYLSHNLLVAHFGLGSVEHVDSIVINWMGGNEQILKNVKVNQTLLIQEDQVRHSFIDSTICKGDSLFLENKYQKVGGTYYDSLKNGQDGLYEVICTKLKVMDVKRDTVNVTLEKGQFFKDYKIQSDTIFVEEKPSENPCIDLVIYKIKIIDVITGIQHGKIGDELNIRVSPNPSIRNYVEVNYHLTQFSDVKISIHNVHGELIDSIDNMKQQIGEQQVQLNVGNFRPGVYYGKIETNRKYHTFKILIE
ncbi:FG-GAP-like repeat-containing protein [Fulvivirgaceae bacterium BMA10]|uniref:FG-GAP-like repeat-containing protein n=1 Tax=Splendidivirga corallicola TaxID=3051826 RepID=A0ABT8KRX3_9BACT|nr:FG-GAP-like repeat-containing protein [Fulvivirgaceae bacterium BMA10]